MPELGKSIIDLRKVYGLRGTIAHDTGETTEHNAMGGATRS